MSDPDSTTSTLPRTASGLTLELVEEAGDWRALPDIEAVVAAVAEALAADPALDLPRQGATATVALGDDTRVRELNRAYRRKDKATNVLSFPAAAPLDDDGEPLHLGDIILAIETVRREADAQGIPLRHHFQHLVLHGLLHLLGYDHETAPEAELMENLETRILARIGVPDPYAGTEPADTTSELS